MANASRIESYESSQKKNGCFLFQRSMNYIDKLLLW